MTRVLGAGKKRGGKKILVGVYATDSDANKIDGVDEVHSAKMARGNDDTYAIPRDAINADLRKDGSPLIKLTGDEFVTTKESFIALLADNSVLVGTGPLTENNSPTYVKETTDDESPIYEETNVNLVSASSQYLSLPTYADVEVGTNSFMAGIAFKTTSTGAELGLFAYGDSTATNPQWGIQINASNFIVAFINDGTNSASISDTIAGRWQDGRWHFATALWDRTSNILYLIVDNVLIGTVSISTVTGSLTKASMNLYIGARSISGSVTRFFNGNLSLFKLVKVADYNIPQVWNLGIREASASGTFTIPINDSNKRLDNKFGTPNTDLAYFYTTANFEDGEYEIQIVYEKSTSGGKLDLIVDGFTIRSGLDTYNSSTTHNNVDKTYKVKITSGIHTIVIKNNGKNGSSSGNAVNLQWINFIKRHGQEYGGLVNALFLGDEIQQNIVGTTLGTYGTTSTAFYLNRNTGSASVDGDYMEGTIFIKGGLYRIDYIYETNSNNGKADLWIGNAQVLSQLNQYTAGSVVNNIKSVYVRLQQGKQKIRLAVNGKNASSSAYLIFMTALRLERVSD